ncbi:squamous cell carcinoma antigen recognized by T-cells 3-like [Corticium candelabrum]|uniref:squamous cell carcinoma antigen recognized by T-cells 3-like n=1 Tax=Corticium candelabrum TaxID=121492 RepID=UPI002E259EF3|nr:squamous cell carcinoma antigen recognized by T-cells 3-like [Corticium candelabrum]
MEDDQSESSSSGDDSNDDSTAVDEDAIARLEEALSTNQYLYDSHVALIAELRKGIGKPDAFYKLRQARERMRKLFPLSEDLWLQWIGDETLFNSTAVDKDFVKGLYDSAVSDYLSVRVWLEYCKFTMGTMVDGLATLDDVRSVFERALMSCGLHVSQGSTLWEAFREFEITILDSVNELSKDENDKDVKLQMDRVANIFKRQLSVPLIGMEATANEFTKWAEEHNVVVSNYTQSYKKALSTLGKCIEYEDRLKQAESPRLEQYKEYIQFEMSAADPARIQCIYERALAENCLHASLWMDYTHFLDTKLKIKDVSLVAHQRAVRNCPWISQLWCSWIRAMERNAVDLMSVKEMFEEGLRCGFSSADDYISLWSAFIDYQWRRRDSVDDKEEIISTVRETFQKAVEHVKQLYGQKADHSCSLKRHWAALEATHFNSIARARELWEEVMSEGHRRSVSMWLEYAELERRCGSVTQTRKLLHEAVVRGSDEPQRAYEALLKFEREEGTLSEWESAWERCQVKVKQITEQRAKMEAVVEEKKKAGKKREDGERKKRKKEIDDDSSAAKRSRGDAEEEMEKAKKTVVRCDDERTVFVSNLQFSTTEDELRQAFSSCGDVTIINVVKDTKWKMKNYAYVEFSLPSAIDAALALDRTLLSGRPMFVSRYGQGGQHRSKPKYPITPDKNTVFVSNLAFGATPEEVKEIFTQCGVVKEVRKTCDALGRPKGFAFVEYEESKSARDAVTVLEGYRLRGRPIKVAISNPPQKSLISKRGGMTGNNMGQRGHVDSEGFAIPLNPGIRTSSRTQISLVPRSVKQKKENETSNGEPIKPSQRLSNKDFRNLLLKK